MKICKGVRGWQEYNVRVTLGGRKPRGGYLGLLVATSNLGERDSFILNVRASFRIELYWFFGIWIFHILTYPNYLNNFLFFHYLFIYSRTYWIYFQTMRAFVFKYNILFGKVRYDKDSLEDFVFVKAYFKLGQKTRSGTT